MATELKIRGGGTAWNDAFTGASRELTVDTDTNSLRVHDGVTVGGNPITGGGGGDLDDLGDVTITSPVTGACLVFNGTIWIDSQTPTFVAPILGTPASGTLTNCTGLPASGVTGTALVAAAIGTTVQAYDLFLTSIALLGTAADKMIYTTGVNTAAETAITAAGRALIDDADATAQRVTLGLVIGTNVQAQDAFLTSIAALGTAADKMIYTTGVDTAAETAVTATGRSILDDASVQAVRATLAVRGVTLASALGCDLV